MLSPSQFQKIISGETTGLLAGLLRLVFSVIAIPYRWVVSIRNRRYDVGQATTFSLSVPVISVGNITLGGTGKTPMVQWIARLLLGQNLKVVLVSRGYGSKNGKPNDEARELAHALPTVPHLQNPDRVAAAREAISQHQAEVILVDDGFQHRRLGRDLDIILLDASQPFGFEKIFPRGTLREPLAGLRRADAVCLTRAELLSPAQRLVIRKQVHALAPNALWSEAVHAPKSLMNLASENGELASLAGKKVAAFCAIGNPLGFRHTLSDLGVELVELREFSDHHTYTSSDIKALLAWFATLEVEALLCTHKDLVKLSGFDFTEIPLWAVSIEIQFLTGKTELKERLLQIAKKNKTNAC